jgi:hypothetical protein
MPARRISAKRAMPGSRRNLANCSRWVGPRLIQFLGSLELSSEEMYWAVAKVLSVDSISGNMVVCDLGIEGIDERIEGVSQARVEEVGGARS